MSLAAAYNRDREGRSLRAALVAAVVLVPLTGGAGATGTLATSRLAGQLVMSPVAGTRADATLLARVRAGEVGGVILFGANITTLAGLRTLVAELQRAAAAGGNPPLLVAVDQEGGRFDV